MTSPHVTPHRNDPAIPARTGDHSEPIVLETADPRRVRRILGGVAAFLLVLVVLAARGDSGSVPLGVNPTRVLGATFERPLPREDSPTTDAAAPEPIIITVPTPVAVDRLVPVIIDSTTSTSRSTYVSRSANGPASPEITRFIVETERPVAGRSTHFRYWAGDADGHIRYLRVDFGDGHEDRQLLADRCVDNPTDPVEERPPFSHTFADPGTYTVTLYVASSGSCGNGPTQTVSASVEVEVTIVDLGTTVG